MNNSLDENKTDKKMERSFNNVLNSVEKNVNFNTNEYNKQSPYNYDKKEIS
jgi:hypothetical protein